MITPESEQSIIDILSLILNKNSFTFNNKHFLQIHGTAMGSPMAPTYANIFMAMLERKLLQKAPNNLIPIEWIRFIDDIFAIWIHGIEKLQQFLTPPSSSTIRIHMNQLISLTQPFTPTPMTNLNQTYTSNPLTEHSCYTTTPSTPKGVIENDPTLRILWPEPPMVAYQKNKNLKDTLVTAKLKTT